MVTSSPLGPETDTSLPHHAHGRHELMAENQVDTSCDSHGRVTSPDTLACKMQRNQAPRAGRVNSDTGTFQIEEVGHSV